MSFWGYRLVGGSGAQAEEEVDIEAQQQDLEEMEEQQQRANQMLFGGSGRVRRVPRPS